MSNLEKQAREGHSRRASVRARKLSCHSTLVAWIHWAVFSKIASSREISVKCGGSFVTEHSIQVGSTLKLADSTGFLSLIRIAWSRQRNERSQDYGFAFVQPLEEQLETAL